MARKIKALGLNDRQIGLLQFIESFHEEYQYGPTYREIMKECGYKWGYDVAKDLRVLLNVGYIETNHPGSPRAIRPKK